MMLNWFETDMSLLLVDVLLLLGLALVISSLGYYRVVYFISIGYAFSIVGMTIVTTVKYFDHLTWVSALQNIFLVFWGLRLGLYLIRREQGTAYRKELVDVRQRSSGMTFGKKVFIWISVSLLYVSMFSPSLFRLTTPSLASSWIMYPINGLGLLLMGGGFLIETMADKQKSDFKARSPKQFCNVGLYRWVRFPNYLGEIMFWVGNWVVGITVYQLALKWLVSLIGVVCIVLIMIGSAKRLEEKQDERYGDQPAYQTFIRTVPILLPFVPVYSLKNVRVYLE